MSTATFQQRLLDKIAKNQPQEEMVSLHAIYCECVKCSVVREIRKEELSKRHDIGSQGCTMVKAG